MSYIKPTFFKLGDITTLTKGSGSKALEQTSESGVCAGSYAHWKKVTYSYMS